MERLGPGAPTYETSKVAERNFRRNFNLGIVNGTLYIGGLAFSQPATVLPVFVSLFTGSSVLIGLTGTLTSVGWLLPQLAVARYVEHMPKKLRLYGIAAVFRLLSWLSLAISVNWANRMDPGLYLTIFFVCLAGFSLTGGASGIAFLDIVGKTIPPERRGSFFGLRRFFSGMIAALAGLGVAYILGSPGRFPFPKNYFLLFSLTFIFLLSAVISFLFVVEPEGTVEAKKERTSGEFVRQVRSVLREDRRFTRFLAVMIMSNTSSLAIPFYVIYAGKVLGAPTSWVGIFVTVDMLSTLVANLIWGYMGDTRGYRSVIRVCTFLSMAAPILALISPSYQLFSLVFVLKGAGATGIWLAKNNYVLEVAPVVRRATYVGILNTSLAFVMLLPIVGGVIVDVSSYPLLFAITAVLMIISVYEASKLEEPRDGATPDIHANSS